jgi:hypothetical protein
MIVGDEELDHDRDMVAGGIEISWDDARRTSLAQNYNQETWRQIFLFESAVTH